MGTTITNTEMTSTATRHTARSEDGSAWSVTWLPGRVLDRNQAVTAMSIAECVDAALDPDAPQRVWPHVAGWAAELGLSDVDAVAEASLSPEFHAAAASK